MSYVVTALAEEFNYRPFADLKRPIVQAKADDDVAK
jgi:hypothetical protein